VKVLRRLRRTYSGEEFLTKDGDHYLRMRIVPRSHPRGYALFLDQLQKLRELGLKDLILPERVEFGDVLKLYYPFRAEASVDLRLLEEEDREHLAIKLLKLAHILSHADARVFAVFGFDDILELDDFYFQLPAWTEPRMVPASAFVDPHFLKTEEVESASFSYTIGKMVEKLLEGRMPPELKELVSAMTAEDIEDRPSHVTLPEQIKADLKRRRLHDYVQLMVPPVGRDEFLQTLEEKMEVLGPGFHVFHIFGPHGVGKSTFLEMLGHDLREHGYKVVTERNLLSLIESVVQVEAERLEELSQDLQEILIQAIKRHEFYDAVKLALGIFFQKLDNLVILIDDYDAGDPDLKLLLKDLAASRYKGKIACVLVTHGVEELDVSATFSLELPPLGRSEMENLVSFVFGNLPQEVLIQVTTWIYSLSRGIPGLAVEILRGVYRRIKENPEEFDPQSVRGFEGLVKARLKAVPTEYLWAWSRLALLGTRFSESELDALVKVLDLPVRLIHSALNKMIKFGFLYEEAEGIYKFSLYEIWEMFAKQVDETEARKIYERLFEVVEDPWLKAWYLEQLGERKAAATWCIKQGVRELDEHNYLKAKMFFEKAHGLLRPGERSYTLGTRLAWIYSELEERHREAVKLLTEHVSIKHLRDVMLLSIALNSGELEKATRIGEALTPYLKEHPPYLRLRILTLLLRLENNKGERSDEFVELAKKELSGFTPVSCAQEIVLAEVEGATALTELLGSSQINPVTIEKIRKSTEALAHRGAWLSLIKLQSEVANRLLPVLPAFAQHLLEQAVGKSRELGIYKGLMDVKFELLIHALYRGQKREFLSELQEIRAVAMAANNVGSIAMTYFLEAMYHAYNKEYDDAVEDLEYELRLEKSSGLHKRSLRALVTVYAMAGSFERARELILRYRDDPAISHPHFWSFAKLIMAESDEEFKSVWKEFTRQSMFWKEEALLIFAGRMIKINRELFLKMAFELEENSALVDMLLPLALIYEALGKAFWADDERLKSRRYLERALALYESIGFKEAAKVVESHPAFAVLKRFMRDRPDWYRMQNLMKDEALFTIRFSRNISSTKELLRYLSDRLKTVLPVERISLILRRFGKPAIVFGELPEGADRKRIRDVSTAQPFRILQTIRVDGEYDLIVYGENPHLMLDNETLEYYLEYFNQMEIALTTTIQVTLARDASITDPLTGLYTRWYFTRRLEEEFERYRRYGVPFTVIMADIDDFKLVNDTYGHPKGDEVLKFIAATMTSVMRATDIAGRYGGEEFIIVLTNTTKERGVEVAEKLRSLVKSKNPFPFPITLSFGVAGVPEDKAERAADLVALADKALYASKNAGKDRVSSA